MEFQYQAKRVNGDIVNGIIEATGEDQAVMVLHQKGLTIIGLNEAEKALFSKDLFEFLNQPGKKDVVVFTRQMATLIDADVPLIEGLHTIAESVSKPSFQKIILSIASAIEGGANFSSALAEHPAVFGTFYVSLVRSGEVSGKLQGTLLYLADYLERSAALNSKIRGALAYPLFVLCSIIAVGFIVMTYVMPQLITILKEAGTTDLPITTKILIWTTDFVTSYLAAIIISFIVIIGGFLYYIRSESGKKHWDKVKLHLPLGIGDTIQNFYIARLSESLATLIHSGVPILESLSITSEVVGNTAYHQVLVEAVSNVKAGGTISEVFDKYAEIKPLVVSMISVGEKTGRVDSMLNNVTKFYKSEAENAVQNLSSLIEPALILIMGLGVGIIVSSVLLPIYSLVSSGG